MVQYNMADNRVRDVMAKEKIPNSRVQSNMAASRNIDVIAV